MRANLLAGFSFSTDPAKVIHFADANVSLDEMAVLVCEARGNPTSATNAFSWRRLLFPKWDEEANEAPEIETTSIGCNDVIFFTLCYEVWNGMIH